MTTPQLVSDLRRDEGVRTQAYVDTTGNLTIGVGHKLPPGSPKDTTWDDAQIDAALAADIAAAEASLDRALAWWRTLNDVRQDVLVEMCFNLGIGGLLGFENMLTACRMGEFDIAADEMRNSLWADQLPNRSARLAAMMQKGTRP